jgi:murein DD-endopeptidase MepM/ murein hydrolase activator NlpD
MFPTGSLTDRRLREDIMAIGIITPFKVLAGQKDVLTQGPESTGDHGTYSVINGVKYTSNYSNAYDYILQDSRGNNISYGAPVAAVLSGRVIAYRDDLADGQSDGGANIGNYITIDYTTSTGSHIYYSYFHLLQGSVRAELGLTASQSFASSLNVYVTAGQDIAKVGMTGATTGPHAHIQFGTSLTHYVLQGGSYRDAVVVAQADLTAYNKSLIQFAAQWADAAPVVSGRAASLLLGQAIAVSSYFGGSDADHDALQYSVTESALNGAGTLYLDGSPINQSRLFSQAEFNRLQYRGSARGSETITVRAWDGQIWSNPVSATFKVAAAEDAESQTVAALSAEDLWANRLGPNAFTNDPDTGLGAAELATRTGSILDQAAATLAEA